jgi:UDP-2,3-diacylglucosamine hydrolase
MSKTFFIADVHLSIDNPIRTRLTLSFLDMVIRKEGDLYILGDLFDFWANNRQVIQSNLKVLNQLQRLTLQGRKVGYLFGNRDFLISPKVLSSFGIDFLGEEAEITLDSKRIFLTHGHMLCAADEKFLRYKQRIWPLFRFLDQILPGFIENFFAQKFIEKSKKVISSQDPSKLQFSVDRIRDCFEKGNDVIICGHAHRLDKQVWGEYGFYALPHWGDRQGGYLLFNQSEFSLHEFTDSDLSSII